MQRGEDTWKKFEERRDRVRREKERKESGEEEKGKGGGAIQKMKERRKNVIWRGEG